MSPVGVAVREAITPSSLGNKQGPEVGKACLRLATLANLDQAEWMRYLSDVGFGDDDIRRLEDTTDSLFNELGLASRLSHALRAVWDLDDEAELSSAVRRCVDSTRQWDVTGALLSAVHPDPVAVLAHAMRHTNHVVDTAVWLERARRRAFNEPEPDFTMTGEEIAEGVALAELGLAQDAATWPPY